MRVSVWKHNVSDLGGRVDCSPTEEDIKPPNVACNKYIHFKCLWQLGRLMFASIAHAHFGEKSGASEWVDVNNLLKVIWLLVKSCWDLLSIEHQTCVVHMAIPMQQTPSGATLKVSAYWPQFMLMAVILRSFDKHLSRPCTLVQRWSFRTWARLFTKREL